jgi:hypothetical protein
MCSNPLDPICNAFFGWIRSDRGNYNNGRLVFLKSKREEEQDRSAVRKTKFAHGGNLTRDLALIFKAGALPSKLTKLAILNFKIYCWKNRIRREN